MSASNSGRKTPVDHGVQIRFINNLQDTRGSGSGGGRREGSGKPSSRYGVAVRVQGIAGQPYVVLNEGDKGDSYGVQLRTTSYNSLPRRTDDGAVQDHYPPPSDLSGLRRAQSHGSLLDRDGDGDGELRRPNGDGRSGSYGHLDGGLERNQWGGSHQTALNGAPERETRRGKKSYYTSSESVYDRTHDAAYDRSAPNGVAPQSAGGSYRGRSGELSGTSVISSAQIVAPNTYAPPPAYPPASTYSGTGRSSGSVAKVHGVPSGSTKDWSSMDGPVRPDLLRDQRSGSELTSEEDQIQQIIYSVLRQGSSESDAAIKHRVRVICEKIQGLKTSRPDLTLKAELENCLDENVLLKEQMSRKKIELDQTHSELTQLRMDRENAEARVRQMEDQLAGLQEELRREMHNRSQNDTVHADLMTLRTELSEANMLHQKQDELLRQRERELTALKGALKDEVATHDKEVETLREQYTQDMERLRSSMAQVSQSQASIEAERQRVNSTVRSLQQQLEESKEDGGHWRDQFQSTREELRNTKQELLQARLEKEEFEEELKELQEKMGSMKQQVPDVKQTQILNQELERCHADLRKAHAEVEKLKVDLDKKTMEIISLKRTNQEQDAEQKYEINRLKDQSRKDKEELLKVHEKSKQLPDPLVVESLRGDLSSVRAEAERLRGQLLSAEEDLRKERERLSSSQTNLYTVSNERDVLEESSSRLKDKISRLEAQLQEQSSQNLDAEQELQEENRKLRLQLEELKRSSGKLSRERDELSRALEERDKERDTVRKENTLLDEQKRQHERTVDRLNKEIERLSAESSHSAQVLHSQLEENKEKWKKEQQDLQRSHTEKVSELEKAQISLRSLQEELSRQKKEALLYCEEKDNAVLDKEMLVNRIKHLEGELQTQRSTYNDRTRDVRSMEDKVKRLELELDEEKSSVELLTDRISRSRDQMEQLRSELMQEKAAKQDLELDKNALERQLKDYKSRLSDMEGQSRSSTNVSQLESKLQDLEEQLRNEEREKNAALSAQRRMERKLKDLNITQDEERQQISDQRDQLTLRVKALKRQLDEREEEVERLEGLRRKAVRDMEEQMEQKDALQTRVVALEKELKRKTQQARLSIGTPGLSSDEDDESLYDTSSITSILTESNLQTSAC